MSKMKDVYFDMVDMAMDYVLRGHDDDEVIQALTKKFGPFFMPYQWSVIQEAKKDVAAFHNDMMHGIYSHEGQYE